MLRRGRLRIYLFGIASIFLFLVAPNSYDYYYNLLLGIVLVCSLLSYFLYKQKVNYFDFDTLFLISYSIAFFIYTIFLYPINPQYFVLFNFAFNESTITRATALSLLGANFYMMGNVFYQDKVYKVVYYKVLPVRIFVIFLYISFSLFLLFGGFTFYENLYAGNQVSRADTIFGYFDVLVRVFVLLSVVSQFYKMHIQQKGFSWKRVDMLLVTFLVLYVLFFLSIGKRGGVIAFFLATLAIYTYYYKPIKLLAFFKLFLCGVLLMSLVGIYRSNENFTEMDFVDLFMDLIVNNRNTFVAIDYVDNHGITYGISMLGNIFRIIPMLSGYLHPLLGLSVYETTSSLLITKEALGEGSFLGLGTSIIADLYLAFGVCGVMIFMGLLGYFVHYLENKMKYNYIYSTIIYVTLMSYSVTLVRAEYFYSLNQIVISIFMFVLISNLVSKRV